MAIGVIFDLDGTLWDASESTARAWSEVFGKYALHTQVKKPDIQSVAGRPYLDCLKIVCPEALKHPEFDSLLQDLSDAEKTWMRKIGGDFYPGAIDAVKSISSRYPVFLVSNCNDWYLRAFLEHSGLASVFQVATCYGLTEKPKSENIKQVLSKAGLQNACYVGDTEGDMLASVAAGVEYIHVAFGFGGKYIQGSVLVLQDYMDITPLTAYLESRSC